MTVARTFAPAVHGVSATIATVMPFKAVDVDVHGGGATEQIAANLPSLTAVSKDAVSPVVVGAPDSAAARAPARAASDRSM